MLFNVLIITVAPNLNALGLFRPEIISLYNECQVQCWQPWDPSRKTTNSKAILMDDIYFPYTRS